ncbi:MAG: TlpA family protein disulfide reductase [Flavobacteriaceae bacterium]|nr:TlpA family protein disulfide reductase [Flavobacteriaceae bacterium]
MKNILIFLLLIVTISSCKEENNEPIVNSKVEDTSSEINPSIPIYNFDGFEESYLEKPHGIYVINFWATWCKPCVKELPAFEKLHENYKNKGVEVILVSLDFPDKLQSGVIPFIEKHQLKSDVILLDDPDANSWIPKVSEDWSGAIPATVLVKDGKKVFFEKSFTYEELEIELNKIL